MKRINFTTDRILKMEFVNPPLTGSLYNKSLAPLQGGDEECISDDGVEIKQNRYKLLIVFCGMLIINYGCKKFVQVEPAPGLINTELVFESEGTALSAVSSVYVQLRINLNVFTNGGMSIYGGLAADEIYATSPNTNTDPFFLNQLLPTTAAVNAQFYGHAYKTIYHANAVLEGLERSVNLPEETRKRFAGEMKVIRSLMNFYLVNLFGDVPLIKKTDYQENAVLPRASVAQVYEQMISDLNDARNLLAANYSSAGKARVNKHTATALLARVYLFKEEWEKAEAFATEIITSGVYSIVPSASIAGVFLKSGSETIWEIASPNEGSAVGDGSSFVPSSATVKPLYALTTRLLNAFESGDKRVQQGIWVGKNTVSGQVYTYPAKYKQRIIASGTAPTEYQVVLRLAEMYLIRAEARARQSNIDGAKGDLNLVRNRAGLPNVTTTYAVSLMNAIEKERQTELFAEWGHRWLDLKRWGKADGVLGTIKGSNWQTTDILWPIPEQEINNNPFLKQNPGY